MKPKTLERRLGRKLDPVPANPEDDCFLRVPVKAVPAVVAALRAAGLPEEAAEVEGFARQYTDPAVNARRVWWRDRADGEARDGEVEFDSDAAISHSPGAGEYVLGWVWVDGPGEDEFCSGCGTTDGVQYGLCPACADKDDAPDADEKDEDDDD
jgi:hypothetical protein